MTPEEFRRAGYELIDWIADYRGRLETLPVRSPVAPGEVAAALSPSPPTVTDSIADLLADLDRIVVPGITTVQHPSHFGWFPSNAALASVLGDLASSGLGALGISWQSAPALTEIEEVVCDWMRRLTGLGPGWRGAIHDTASTACLVALLAARERAGGHSAEGGGLQAVDRPLTVYASDQAHSSVLKAALLAGFGRDNVRLLPTHPWTRALQPETLAAAMDADAAAGRCPAAVVVSVGTTGTTAVDPLAELLLVAARHGAWVHVDAAMAGSALLLPEFRGLVHGIDGSGGSGGADGQTADPGRDAVPGADSLSWNPHKWMGTVLDCSLLYVRRPDELVRVMSTSPSYLRSAADGAVTQYRDWGIPLGRRFRALKLWFHLRLDGVDAIRERLRRDVANARWLESRVAAEPGWRVLAPVPLQTVCVRHEPPGLVDADGTVRHPAALDEHTLAWAEALNRSGAALVTPALLDGRWMVRVSVGVETTERRHVEALWERMRAAASSAQDVRAAAPSA